MGDIGGRMTHIYPYLTEFLTWLLYVIMYIYINAIVLWNCTPKQTVVLTCDRIRHGRCHFSKKRLICLAIIATPKKGRTVKSDQNRCNLVNPMFLHHNLGFINIVRLRILDYFTDFTTGTWFMVRLPMSHPSGNNETLIYRNASDLQSGSNHQYKIVQAISSVYHIYMYMCIFDYIYMYTHTNTYMT